MRSYYAEKIKYDFGNYMYVDVKIIISYRNVVDSIKWPTVSEIIQAIQDHKVKIHVTINTCVCRNYFKILSRERLPTVTETMFWVEILRLCKV